MFDWIIMWWVWRPGQSFGPCSSDPVATCSGGAVLTRRRSVAMVCLNLKNRTFVSIQIHKSLWLSCLAAVVGVVLFAWGPVGNETWHLAWGLCPCQPLGSENRSDQKIPSLTSHRNMARLELTAGWEQATPEQKSSTGGRAHEGIRHVRGFLLRSKGRDRD